MATVTVDFTNPIRARRYVKGTPRQDTYLVAKCSCGNEWEIRKDCAEKVQMCQECSQRIKARKGGRATLKKYGRAFLLSLVRKTRLEKTTCLERIVEGWLIELGAFYEREYTFFTYDRWECLIDFMVNGGALAVEVHGKRWHEDPEAMERDARKAAALRYDGIPLLILSENEVVSGDGYARLKKCLAF